VDDVILVLNSGSSSIKFSVFAERSDRLEVKFRGQVEGLYSSPRFIATNSAGKEIGAQDWGQDVRLGHEGATSYLTAFLCGQRDENRLIGVGHRVVHGGQEFSSSTLVSMEVLAKLEKLIPLAPLHQPHNLAPIHLISQRRPELPQVACFDTAFHCTQDKVAQAFALPSSITQRGIRRYGFHGLS
jgi:acetate kinase